ncbi:MULTISPECIES: hypothetical protein [unclassified Bradyrhizobium]|uniref:hypothetical protein n=1 Tax=unclassified Bradyrhizobium TaxID=2631580 RepID=UPI002915D6F4|nr:MULTISPECIES: hypothetical protein [unclassified Bradyrhizobium]
MTSAGSGRLTNKLGERAYVFYCCDLAGKRSSFSAYLKDGVVRLVGSRGKSHVVSGGNAANVEGWKREAQLVWKLPIVKEVPALLIGTEFDKEARVELEILTNRRRKDLDKYGRTFEFKVPTKLP